MDRRLVVEARVSIGVADRDVVTAAVVPLEDRHDLLRREPVDRGEDRRVDQPAVRERQEVEVVVDQVELVRLARTPSRCAGPPTPWRRGSGSSEYPVGIVPTRVRRRHRVGGGEQRDVHAALDQPLGQERHELLPRAVVARRHPPRDRREHRDTESGWSPRRSPQRDPARRTSPDRAPVNSPSSTTTVPPSTTWSMPTGVTVRLGVACPDARSSRDRRRRCRRSSPAATCLDAPGRTGAPSPTWPCGSPPPTPRSRARARSARRTPGSIPTSAGAASPPAAPLSEPTPISGSRMIATTSSSCIPCSTTMAPGILGDERADRRERVERSSGRDVGDRSTDRRGVGVRDDDGVVGRRRSPHPRRQLRAERLRVGASSPELLDPPRRPRREQGDQERRARGVRVLIAADIDPVAPRSVERVEQQRALPPVLRPERLAMRDLHPSPGATADLDRLVERLAEPVALRRGCGWRTGAATWRRSVRAPRSRRCPRTSPERRSSPVERPTAPARNASSASAHIVASASSREVAARPVRGEAKRPVADERRDVVRRTGGLDPIQVAGEAPREDGHAGKEVAPRIRRRRRADASSSGATENPQLPTTSVVTPWSSLNGCGSAISGRRVRMRVRVDEPGRDELAPRRRSSVVRARRPDRPRRHDPRRSRHPRARRASLARRERPLR